MKIIAIIPSRYGSSRLHAKSLAKIGDKTLVHCVYEAVKNTALFDDVIIATDHQAIFEEVCSFGGHVEMTSINHQSGSDRIAEVAEKIDCDIVVNVQGDEPFIRKEPLSDLIHAFGDSSVQVASLMTKIDEINEVSNPNNVKVITDIFNNAIYFSRSVIPYQRNLIENQYYYKHIGVYAYKKETLLKFVKMPQSVLEKTESLEQLRLLENEIKIKMIETPYHSIGIDTQDDLEKANEYVRNSK